MSKEKRRIIYITVWAAALVAILISALAGFGYEDPDDITLAIMFLVIPVLVMIGDMAHFFRYEKYYTAFKFIAVNFLIVLGISFVLESAAILISFGILRPQVKLFIFAAAFSVMAAVLNLLQSCFLVLVMREKAKKQ